MYEVHFITHFYELTSCTKSLKKNYILPLIYEKVASGILQRTTNRFRALYRFVPFLLRSMESTTQGRDGVIPKLSSLMQCNMPREAKFFPYAKILSYHLSNLYSKKMDGTLMRNLH